MPADDNQIGSFTYSSQPHSAPTSKKSNNKLYRDNDKGNVFPLSVMADPRIVRGNTHSLAKKISLQTQLDLKATANTNVTFISQALTICHVIHSKAEKVFVKEDPSRPTFRYEVKPFSNNEIDVSQYLVEVPTIVKKQEVISQTDSFKERPKTPPYVPRKTGVDRSTQVEDVRELFSFDQEVSGMLEVLVSKTLQSALFEVESEAELLSLQIEAENFQRTIAIENDWIREKEIQDAKEVARVQEVELLCRRSNLRSLYTVLCVEIDRPGGCQEGRSGHEDDHRVASDDEADDCDRASRADNLQIVCQRSLGAEQQGDSTEEDFASHHSQRRKECRCEAGSARCSGWSVRRISNQLKYL